MSKKAGREVA